MAWSELEIFCLCVSFVPPVYAFHLPPLFVCFVRLPLGYWDTRTNWQWGTRTPGDQDTRTSGHQDIGTPGHWETRTPGHHDIRRPGQWVGLWCPPATTVLGFFPIHPEPVLSTNFCLRPNYPRAKRKFQVFLWNWNLIEKSWGWSCAKLKFSWSWGWGWGYPTFSGGWVEWLDKL